MNMNAFLSGMLVVLPLGIAAFQLRFWKKTKDRLFLYFMVSFILLGTTRGGLFALEEDSETRTYFYLVRFVAFVLIIIAIVDKNRRARRD